MSLSIYYYFLLLVICLSFLTSKQHNITVHLLTCRGGTYSCWVTSGFLVCCAFWAMSQRSLRSCRTVYYILYFFYYRIFKISLCSSRGPRPQTCQTDRPGHTNRTVTTRSCNKLTVTNSCVSNQTSCQLLLIHRAAFLISLV